jgi:hypothetical protein
VLLVIINSIFLVDIELTLSRNKHFQLAGDELWGSGQVLALLLLVLPLRDAWNAYRDIQTAVHGIQERLHQALREEIAATPIFHRLQGLVTDGADPRRPIEQTGFGNSLQLAAYHGRQDIVEFLLSEESLADKRVIETDSSKITNRYHAITASLFFSGGGYGTALQAASANGQMGVVQQLVELNNKDYLNMQGECFNVNGLDR